MKKLALVLLLLVITYKSKAQERFFTARNSIQLEVPSRTIYSLSYERIWIEGKKMAWNSKVGLGVKGGAVPLQGMYVDFGGITTKSKHHFEAAAQFAYFRQKNHPPTPQFTIAEHFIPSMSVNYRLGYRFQKPNSGWIFRANAMFEFLHSDYIGGRIKPKLSPPIPWPILAIGRSF